MYVLGVHVAVYVAVEVGGFVTVPKPHVYPVLVAVGTVIVPPDHCAYNVAPPSFIHFLLALVYPDTLATNLPFESITLEPPLVAVYQPLNVHVLVALVADNVAPDEPLNCILFCST